MMRFPLDNLLDEEASYEKLRKILHPAGLHCPAGHPLPPAQAPHMTDRAPLVDYRCRTCGAVYNLLTETVWSGTHYNCNQVLLLTRGFTKGFTTQQLADELALDYGTVLKWRHRVQKQALAKRPDDELPDERVEIDEMYPNAGEKGTDHDTLDEAPRPRGNQQRGAGTRENDRPPVLGVVGRASDKVRLDMLNDTQQQTVLPEVDDATTDDVTAYTDGSPTYDPLQDKEMVAQHQTVHHSEGEFARDPDHDGENEVHTNTVEGTWSALRIFLAPFRGVHQKYLDQYNAMFAWAHELKEATDSFLRLLLCPDFTLSPI